MGPDRPLREVALVYIGVTAVTFAITRMRVFPWAAQYVHLLVAAVFLVVAVRLAQREPDGTRRYGIDMAGLLSPPEEQEGSAGPLGLFDLARALWRALPAGLREGGIGLSVCLVVFPPFAVGFWLWNRPPHAFEWALPEDFASFLLAQLVVVALPEEAFFRGYVQTRLDDAWRSTTRLLGVPVSLRALTLQGALFAIMHFAVDLDPSRLAVFFPGLLFGWLRAWRGGMGAAIVVHALSNVYADILARSWL